MMQKSRLLSELSLLCTFEMADSFNIFVSKE